MNYKHFDFLVEEMTEEQALKLLEFIVEQVSEMGLKMGGGYSTEVEDEQEDRNLPRL